MSNEWSKQNYKNHKEKVNDLTEKEKRQIRWAYENAEGLADRNGGWRNDLTSVVETGRTIMWLLEETFDWLEQDAQSEPNDSDFNPRSFYLSMRDGYDVGDVINYGGSTYEVTKIDAVNQVMLIEEVEKNKKV